MRYKLRSFLALSALASSLTVAPATFAADEEEEHSPLHEAMETMGETYRDLSRGLRRPDPAAKADYLGWLQTVQEAAIVAKKYVPAQVEKVPEAERPAMITGYRSDLAAAIETMLQIERAILADDWEKAQELARQLGSQRSDAHKKYNPDEE